MVRPFPAGAIKDPEAFFTVNLRFMAVLRGHARRLTSQYCGVCPARAVSKLYTMLATCAVAWLLIALITRLPAALQVGRMNSFEGRLGAVRESAM
jgi:hypothetical protein